VISEHLRQVAARHRHELAIVDGSERITFGGLLERINAAREWLRSELHLSPGGVIAIALDNSWRFVACCFAVSELGGVSLLCNPQWRAAELAVLAERVGFRAAIVEPRLAAEWHRVLDPIPHGRVLTADSVPAEAYPERPIHPASEDDPAIYLSTSGSTGLPRIVPRSHRNLAANARNVGSTLDIGSGHRFLGIVPFHYSNGFNNNLLLPLLNSAVTVMLPRFTPSACVDLIHREQVNTLIGSPFIYGSLAASVGDASLLSSLKHCFTAGGRIPASVVETWRARFGISVRQLYGMSEAGVIAIEGTDPAPASSLDPLSPDSSSPDALIGPPILGVEVVILGPDGQTLQPGEIGELAVRSDCLFSGYLGEPEPSRGLFLNGFFRTGDLGYFDAAGNLRLNGRMGRVMNIAGVKVHPAEIERVVEMLPSVAACHVDTVPNGSGGEMIRARVVPGPGAQVTRREIIEHCRRHLAEYKLPRTIDFLESSPVTIGGKIPRSGP
jgi:long-chain acyl-CoA synthetase